MLLPAQEDQPTNPTSKFVEKGRSFVTLTFSLNHRQAENDNQLIREVIDQNRINYRVTTIGGYALKDNLTLGLGLTYRRESEDIQFIDQNNQDITSKLISQELTFTPNMRNFVPLGNGTIQIFIQTDLSFTLGETLERRFYNDDIDKIESTFFEGRLGVKPGAVLFFNRNWAFEASVGLAGFSSRVSKMTTNNEVDNQTRVVQNDVDLKINLLDLNLGVAYYF